MQGIARAGLEIPGLISLSGDIILGVYQQGTDAGDIRRLRRAQQGIPEQGLSQPPALMRLVHRQASQDHHRHRVPSEHLGHALWRRLGGDAADRQTVETGDTPAECGASGPGTKAIWTEQFSELLAKIPSQRLVVVLDACHAGAVGEIKGGAGSELFEPGLGSALDQLAQGTGRIIMSSSKGEETSAALKGSRNGLFTEYLLKGLTGDAPHSNDGMIRVFNLFDYVSREVPQQAKKHEHVQHPLFKASTQDNFPLARCPTVKPPSPPPSSTTPGQEPAGPGSEAASPSATPTEQKDRVLGWLQVPGAKPFLDALTDDIKRKFGHRIVEARGVVDFFAECQPGEVQDRFWAIRRAVRLLWGTPQLEPARQAIEGLYLLAATRLVNQAAGRIEGATHARRVGTEELSLCAVVVSSLIGGELQFKLAADGRSWVPSYVFHIHVPVAGGNERRAFLRQAYEKLVGEDSADGVRAVREDAELNPLEAAKLRSALGDLRHVKEVTVGFLNTGALVDDATACSIATSYKVPVLLRDANLTADFLEMPENDLLAELEELWKLFPATVPVSP